MTTRGEENEEKNKTGRKKRERREGGDFITLKNKTEHLKRSSYSQMVKSNAQRLMDFLAHVDVVLDILISSGMIVSFC